MSARPNWQPAQAGVMLYIPATRVGIEDTEQSLSQLSVSDNSTPSAHNRVFRVSNTIIPSCEDETEVQIKHEPSEQSAVDLSKEDSSDTLAGDNDDELLFDISPVARLTPESTVSCDLLSQLMTAAEDGSFGANTTSAAISADYNAALATENFLETCYDSDRTDFRESPSPSVRKSKKTTKRTTGAVSQHFKKKPQSYQRQSLVRRLSFGNRLKKQAAEKIKRSANAISLENLRSIEQAPSHNWDDDERELLCVMNRWYSGRDRTAELEVFAKLFNSITRLSIPPKRVRIQFENHLRLYGGEAYPVFARVFSVPFDDPEGRYAKIRALIEAQAVTLGLDLQQRQRDSTVRAGTAKFAKSPKTRKFYKSLVRRASQEAEWHANQVAGTENIVGSSHSMATISKAVCIPDQEDWEIVTDVEQSPAPVVDSGEVPKPASARPHLTFRVWDATNRTKFVYGSFVAQTFVDWPRPFPAPIALDDPSEAGKILTVLHLSKQGDTPVYISTASSLLQALSYAMNMQRPRIALIDLDAPSLQQENKLHHAADIFPWLKSQGLARWARYKGNGEYFIWSDIQGDAVLNHLDLEYLIRDLNADSDCHDLLSFDVFEPGTKTNTIAAALREKNAMLNITTARALGKIARIFGLNGSSITLEHLQDFVARLMDGWTITKPEAVDMHTMSSFAATFATAIGSHAGGYTLQQVMSAFIQGVDHGTHCIAHWSKSGSCSRRQHFRDA